MRPISKASLITFLMVIFCFQARAMERRLIVKYRNGSVGHSVSGNLRGNGFQSNYQVQKYKKGMSDQEMQNEIARLSQNPNIEYIEEDKVLRHMNISNDSRINDQWGLVDSLSGIEVDGAWNQTTGDNNEVIAIIDTGILGNHPDLAGKVLNGVDMISDLSIANDGDGRDNDPTDPGDYIEPGDSCFGQVGFQNSSWHGTHVAGIAAASGNNNTGIAGVNHRAKILPIRVLGTCGGFTSDIADGIRWAAGGNVPGVSPNTTPAKVINLSLGAEGLCSAYMQDAINFAVAQGSTVVAAAGNSDSNVAFFTPVNCANVIRVGALARNGGRAHYSNFGAGIDVMAPGGDGNEGPNGILSTHNSGTRTALSFSSYGVLSGTSQAAPHVAGVISLMYAINSGSNNDIYPGQVLQIIKDTARGFASHFNPQRNCQGNSNCGAGIIDADAAVAAADGITPDPSVPGNPSIAVGRNVASVLEATQEGGGCGAVAISALNGSDDGDGSGGKGGPLSLTVGFMLAILATRFKKKDKLS